MRIGLFDIKRVGSMRTFLYLRQSFLVYSIDYTLKRLQIESAVLPLFCSAWPKRHGLLSKGNFGFDRPWRQFKEGFVQNNGRGKLCVKSSIHQHHVSIEVI